MMTITELAQTMGVSEQDAHGFVAGLSLQLRKALASGQPFTFDDVVNANQAAFENVAHKMLAKVGTPAARQFVVDAFFPAVA